MLKGTFILIAGGLCGGAVAYLLLGAESAGTNGAAGGSSFFDSLPALGASRGADEVRAADVSAHVAAYRSAATHASADTLAADLERAAVKAPSIARDLEIDALLARLSELAPERAASVANELGLAPRFVVAAWLDWAERDTDAALAALGTIRSAATRQAVALALLDVVGDSQDGIARIAAALSNGERSAFTIAALAGRAAHDPHGALREALALGDPSEQARALTDIAAAWAREDPRAALAHAATLPADMQQLFKTSAGAEWGRLDPAGFLLSIDTNATAQDVSSGLRFAAIGDPEGVLALADRSQGQLAQTLTSAGMNSLAQSDLPAARARAEAMPPGQARDQALQTVASAFARVDPDGALAWIKSLPPSTVTQNMQRNAISAIAASGDVERALSLAATAGTGPAGLDQELVLLNTASRAAQDSRQARELASDLADKTDAQSKAMLSRLLQSWSQRDPDAAMAWTISQGDRFDATAIGNLARTMAGQNAESAAAYTTRVPAAMRAVWIAQVAAPYGRYDPAGAQRWLEQYRGQPGYDIGLRQLAMQTAQTDAPLAAQMLVAASGDVQLGAAQTVASTWARTEPAAAAQWAETLSDPRARMTAMTAVTTAWAQSDLPAATRWVLSKPASEARDDSLLSIMQRNVATNGTIDGALFAGFSSSTARERALTRVLPLVAARDPAAARRMLDTYEVSPQLRQQVEQIAQRGPQAAAPPSAIQLLENAIIVR